MEELRKLLEKYIAKTMAGDSVSSVSVAGRQFDTYQETKEYIDRLRALEEKGVFRIKFSKTNEMKVKRVYLVLDDEKIKEAEKIVKNIDDGFQTRAEREETKKKKQKETETYSELAKSQLDKNEKMAKLIHFLETNTKDMYVREISQLLVSDTKKIKKDDV